jgi:hypothetical protein
MPKQRPTRDSHPNKIFRIKLSSAQMNDLSTLLPKGYFVVLDDPNPTPSIFKNPQLKNDQSYRNINWVETLG